MRPVLLFCCSAVLLFCCSAVLLFYCSAVLPGAPSPLFRNWVF
jgi:hypothetical protein